MKNKLFVLLLIMLGWSNIAQAQISHGGTPISFTDTTCMAQNNCATISLSILDNDSLLLVDSLMSVNDSLESDRFGISRQVNIGLSSGTWEVLEDSSRLWRLHVASSGSYAFNVILSMRI